MKNLRRKGALLATLAFAAMMTMSGVLYIVGPRPLLDSLRELGYPVYFLKLLGGAKLLGVAALLTPGYPTLREWAYAGFTFDLLAAIASHALTGGVSHLPPPIFALGVLLASYVLRRRREAPVLSRMS